MSLVRRLFLSGCRIRPISGASGLRWGLVVTLRRSGVCMLDEWVDMAWGGGTSASSLALSITVIEWPESAHWMDAARPERPAPTMTMESGVAIVLTEARTDRSVSGPWVTIRREVTGDKLRVPASGGSCATIVHTVTLQPSGTIRALL